MIPKRYIGDAVYVDHDGFAVVITTESGIDEEATNIVYMEPSVLKQFEAYLADLKQAVATAKVLTVESKASLVEDGTEVSE